MRNKSHISDVLKALKNVKDLGGGQFVACCPAHEDKKPSLSIKEGDHGRVLVFCHVGCSFAEIRDALLQRGLRI